MMARVRDAHVDDVKATMLKKGKRKHMSTISYFYALVNISLYDGEFKEDVESFGKSIDKLIKSLTCTNNVKIS